jgi:hypothetical protein
MPEACPKRTAKCHSPVDQHRCSSRVAGLSAVNVEGPRSGPYCVRSRDIGTRSAQFAHQSRADPDNDGKGSYGRLPLVGAGQAANCRETTSTRL